MEEERELIPGALMTWRGKLRDVNSGMAMAFVAPVWRACHYLAFVSLHDGWVMSKATIISKENVTQLGEGVAGANTFLCSFLRLGDFGTETHCGASPS